MNIVAKYSLPFLAVTLLAGCGAQTPTSDAGSAQAPSASSKAAEATTSSVDHHEGEANVQPHDDSVSSAPADHVDDPNEPAHSHSSSHDDSNQPPHRH